MAISPAKDVNVMSNNALIKPSELEARIPLTATAEEVVLDSRRQLEAVLNGEDERFAVIVGPCSIHDQSGALDYAARLKPLADRLSDRIMIVMRVYFEKPRTTVGWKGLIYDPNLNDTYQIEDGLHRARKLLMEIAETGLSSATEFLDPIVPQYVSDLVTWAAIGARTTESQIHRQMASGLSMPVGFKNGTDGDPQTAVDALVAASTPQAFLGIDHDGQASIVETRGNRHCHLVMRGGRSGTNFDARSIGAAAEALRKADAPTPIVVDCSHGNSNKDHTRQHIAFREVLQQRLAGNSDLIGVMLESNINAGAQKLGADPAELEYGISITDSCIGWDETVDLLDWAYEAIGSDVAVPAD
ncbi:Phospho-2-dehydro-3-deoxyheptonate aldolase, Trp-sensitive [Geodia barretti]|uniref:3-deoxy-7-phosphoheptulonate synthase n=3 Tax=Geodia barretti TaxID=519541 RepID=A0AA35RVB7_GEOBA|nr:Phospho-2-dehydro-3-deoxyheptonate aldolase, Trp-sensitive [Geodia barretti]